jgi:hypothetical protein
MGLMAATFPLTSVTWWSTHRTAWSSSIRRSLGIAEVDFTERDGKTEVAVHLVFESPEVFSYVVREYHADEVLTQTLNRLGEQLAKL